MAGTPTPPSTPAAKPLWRRVLRWIWRLTRGLLLTVLAIVAVLLLVVLWLTQTASGHAVLVKQALRIVNDSVLAGDASVGRLEGNLFGGVTLRDVVLTDASGEVAVSVDELAVQWDLMPLLQQHVEVTSVSLDGAMVAARIEEDGGLNLARLVQPSEPKPPNPNATPWTVAVRDVSLARVGFSLSDARNDDSRLVMVRDLTAQGNVTIDAEGVIDAALGTLRTSLATPMVEQSTLELALGDVAVRSGPDALDASVGAMEVEGTELSELSARIIWSDDEMFERIEGALEAIKLSAADLNRAIGQDILAVPVGLAATVEGPPDDLRLRLRLSGPGEAIDLVLRLDISEPAVPGYRLRADVVRLSPARWLAIEVPEADVSVGIVVEGRGITPDDATGEVRLDIGPSQVMGWGIDGGAVSARYADGAVTIDRLDAWTTGLEVDASASASLEGAFSIDTRVAVTDLSLISSWSPLTNDVAGRVDVGLQAAGNVPLERMEELASLPPVDAAEMLLGDVSLEASVDARDLRWDDIEADDIELTAEIPRSPELQGILALDVAGVRVPGAPELTDASLDARYADERVRLSLVATEAAGRRARVEAGVELTDDGVRAGFSTLELSDDRIAIRLVEPASVDVELDDAFAPTAVETSMMRLAMGTSRVDVQASWHDDGRVDVDLESKGVDLAPIGELVAPDLDLAGVVDFQLALGGRLQDPTVSFGGSLQDVGVGPVRDVDIRGAVELADERLDAKVNIQYGGIPMLMLDTGDAGIPLEVDLARGIVEPDWEGQIAASAKIPEIQLDELFALIPGLDLPLRGGRLAGHLTIDGTVADPALNLRIELDGVDVLPPGVSAQGTGPAAGADETDTGDEPEPDENADGVEAANSSDTDQADADPTAVDDAPSDDEADTEDANTEDANTEDANTVGPVADDEPSGRDAPASGAAADASDDVPLEPEWAIGPIDAAIDIGFDGVSADLLDVRVTATLDDAPLLTAAVTTRIDAIALARGDLDIETWLDDAAAELSATAGPVRLSALPAALVSDVPLDNGRVEVRLSWEGSQRDGAFIAEVIADQLEMGTLPPFGVRIRVDSGDETSVLARFAAGEPDLVQRTLYARAFNDIVERFDVPSTEVPQDVAGAELLVSITQGWRDLIEDGPDAEQTVEGRLNVAGAPMSLFFDLPDDAPPLTGVLRGYVDVTGSPVAPQVLGRLAVREMSLGEEERGTIATEFAYDGSAVRVQADMCSSNGDAIDVTATADVGGPIIADDWSIALPDVSQIPIDVSVIADGAQLAGILPRFATTSLFEDVDGTLSIDMNVAGTPADPRFDGSLVIEDGAMGIIPLGRSFEGIQVEMTLDADGVVIENLVIRDGGGRLSGDGRVGLRDMQPSNVELTLGLRNFLVADPSGAGVYVDGDVTIDGAMQGDVFDAEVELNGLTVTVPDNTSGATGGPTSMPEYVLFVHEEVEPEQVGSRRPRRIGEEETAAPNPFEANIHVATRGRNTVEHSLADVRFTVDLDVNVDAEDFRITGAVELPSGRVTFAGKPFDITRGFITFDGRPSNVDPVIDVRAAHTLSPAVAARLPAPASGEASVQVVVDGRVSELTDSENESIRLQSDPEMSRQDILYVLLTGRPRDADADATADQQALATASSLLLGLLGDRLADDLPIDTLRIEGDSQSGQAIARVEGGKFIAEDLYVAGTYINSQDPEENDFEFAIQWIIARLGSASVRTELRMGNRGKGGLELLYSLTRRGRARAEPDEPRRESRGAGDESATESEATEPSDGDPTEEDAGEDGAGEDGAGEDGAGEDGAGEDGAGEDGAGEDGAAEEGAAEEGAAEEGSGRGAPER